MTIATRDVEYFSTIRTDGITLQGERLVGSVKVATVRVDDDSKVRLTIRNLGSPASTIEIVLDAWDAKLLGHHIDRAGWDADPDNGVACACAGCVSRKP